MAEVMQKYNNITLKRALKKTRSEEEHGPSTSLISKVTCVDSMHDSKCFFCHLELSSEYLHAATLELDQHVCHSCRIFERDTTLLAQLSTGNMVAIRSQNTTPNV